MIIKNCTSIDGAGGMPYQSDVKVKDGVITKIETNLPEGDTVIPEGETVTE